MVETGPLPPGTVRVPAQTLGAFMAASLRAAGVEEAHARLTAEVLLDADLRGVRSHGAARLPQFVNQVERGVINKRPKLTYRAGSDTTGVLDADNGLGTVAADRAMEEALAMAERHGTGFVAVRNSNHWGYPAYWSRKAARRGCIGIAMSNGGRFVAPTFSVEPVLGTNPLAVTIPGTPSGEQFHLDMATSAVARGKIETALREGTPIPKGWVPEAFQEIPVDERGIMSYDVPLLPLGGEGTVTGGHKGYALSLMVELLSSVLSGLGVEEAAESTDPMNLLTGHLLGAIRVSGFRGLGLVQAQINDTFQRVRAAKKAPGHDRIFIPGEPEAMAEEENGRLGVPITPPIMAQLRRLNERLALGFEL